MYFLRLLSSCRELMPAISSRLRPIMVADHVSVHLYKAFVFICESLSPLYILLSHDIRREMTRASTGVCTEKRDSEVEIAWGRLRF